MRIFIDLQSCQSGSRLGGIGRYSLELAKEMVQLGSQRGHECGLILNGALPGVNEIRDEFKGILRPGDIHVFAAPLHVSATDRNETLRVSAELMRDWFISALAPDVLHITSMIEGHSEGVVISAGGSFTQYLTVATIYDLIPLVNPSAYLNSHLTRQHYLSKIAELSRVDGFLAISDFSMEEAIQQLALDPTDVVNISGGVGKEFNPREVDATQRNSGLTKFGIEKKFIIFVGSFDERKNHRGLIQGYALLEPQLREDFQLVIVGNGWDGVYKELRAFAGDLGVDLNDLIFTGRVEDSDLLDLYAAASLFVFPSFAEGFGLPALEAMSAGLPTIASNTSSLPEVVGLSDALFDPKSVESISRKMAEYLSNPTFLKNLRDHGLMQAAKFTWLNSATRAMDFIEAQSRKRDINGPTSESPENLSDSLIQEITKAQSESRPLRDSEILTISDSIALNESTIRAKGSQLKVRIGWVSTWGTKCGIASYSEHLIAGLPNSEVVIFAPKIKDASGNEHDGAQRCWVEGSPDLSDLEEAVLTSNISVLVIQVNYGFFEFRSLSRLIKIIKDAGITVVTELHSTLDPKPEILDRKLSTLSSGLVNSDIVLVHTIADVRRLEEIGVKPNVTLFPLGLLNASVDWGRKVGPFLLLSTYGFLLPGKGLSRILEAVAALKEKGVPVRLSMYNALYPVVESEIEHKKLQQMIDQLQIREIVAIETSFDSDEETLRKLRQTDVTVFTYPESGESSSAAARMALASGNLVAVNKSAIFEELEGLTWSISGQTSVEIAESLEELWDLMKNDAPKLSCIVEKQKTWLANSSFENFGAFFERLVRARLAFNE